MGNGYVFVQYGQMLLDKGDYLAFKRLNPEAVFGKENRINQLASRQPASRSRRSNEMDENRVRERERRVHWDEDDKPPQRMARSQRSRRRPRLIEEDTEGDLECDELEILRQNWRLLEATCTVHTKGDTADALKEAWYSIGNFPFGTKIGSTEVSVAHFPRPCSSWILTVSLDTNCSVVSAIVRKGDVSPCPIPYRSPRSCEGMD